MRKFIIVCFYIISNRNFNHFFCDFITPDPKLYISKETNMKKYNLLYWLLVTCISVRFERANKSDSLHINKSEKRAASGITFAITSHRVPITRYIDARETVYQFSSF